MLGMNQLEVQALAEELSTYQGYELTRFHLYKDDFALGLWSGEKIIWCLGSMNKARPYLIPIETLPLKFPKIKKPLTLFFDAHLKQQKITNVGFEASQGRCLRLVVADDGEIEFRLFPHGSNLIFSKGSKRVSWYPIQELVPFHSEFESVKCRSFHQLYSELYKNPREIQKKELSKQDFEASRKRLKRQLQKMREDLESRKSLKWRKVAEELQKVDSLSLLKEDYGGYIDAKITVLENREKAYEQAKKNESKILRLEEKIKEIQSQLEGELPKNSIRKKVKKNPSEVVRRLPVKEVGGKTFRLDETARIFVGNSAKDNLSLLRKAKPWDLWVHLRDRPSAHGIVFKDRHRIFSSQEEKKLFLFFLKKTLGSKYDQHIGQRMDLIITECRHVQPIKGDRLGRVTVRQERNRTMVIE
ncbi:MAG: hypothetical protein KDD61_11400 [Bdellovibrionales bacterium]|nr:hypothetical protein [Bdellovibrionales bacterium]